MFLSDGLIHLFMSFNEIKPVNLRSVLTVDICVIDLMLSLI